MIVVSTSCSDFLEEYSQDKAQVETWEDLDELLLGDGHLEPALFSNNDDTDSETPENLNILHLMGDEMQENPIQYGEDDLLYYRKNRFAFFT